MGIEEPDVLAAAATVLSPGGTDPVRDRIVAEVVVALFRATDGVEVEDNADLDVVVTGMREFYSLVSD